MELVREYVKIHLYTKYKVKRRHPFYTMGNPALSSLESELEERTVCEILGIPYNIDTGDKEKIHNSELKALQEEYKKQETIYKEQCAIESTWRMRLLSSSISLIIISVIQFFLELEYKYPLSIAWLILFMIVYIKWNKTLKRRNKEEDKLYDLERKLVTSAVKIKSIKID